MKKLLLITFLFSAFELNAQTTAYFKVANHGSLLTIQKVSSGGYITIGQDSVWKMQIIRWDDNFVPMWKYKITDSLTLQASMRIAEANDGSFYFSSSSTEYSGSTWVIKFSSTGTELWQKVYYQPGGNTNTFAFSKAATGDNGFLFGGGSCYMSNYIVKCDANGAIQWQNQYIYPLSTGVITCFSIIPDGNGYVVSSSYNINSLLTMKLDSYGTVTSHTAYTYAGMQIMPTRIVKLNASGGYAIVGNYNNSNNNKTEFVAIYSSSLALLSFNELTVTYDQFTLWDITPINNGANVIVSGSIYHNYLSNTALINLSASGSIVWKKRSTGVASGIKNVEFYGVTTHGNLTLACGYGYNEGCIFSLTDNNGAGLCNDQTFDLVNVQPTLALQSATITTVAGTAAVATVNYTYNTSVNYNKLLYCGAIGTNDLAITNQDIDIFPNPAYSNLNLNIPAFADMSNAVIEIYSLEGKLIKSYKAENDNVSIDISALNEGIYLIKLSDDKNVAVKRFVKL